MRYIVALFVLGVSYVGLFQQEEEHEEAQRRQIIANASCSCTTTPVITTTSGTIGHGNTVTINGCCFGTKSTAAPLLYDNFEAGTLGGNIDDQNAVVGNWDSDSSPADPVYSNSIAHEGSKSSHHAFSPTDFNISLTKFPGDFTRLYMDYWFYLDFIDNESRNFKPWRWWGNDDQIQINTHWQCEGNGGPGGIVIDSGCAQSFSQSYFSGFMYEDAQWIHVAVEYLESGVDQSNGVWRSYTNQEAHGTVSSAIKTRGCPFSLSQITIGHYWAGDAAGLCDENSGANVFVDNVYLDTVWNRVELCNAATYASATHCEIQRPTAWSTTATTIAMNTGSIGAGTRYLFVVDADGDKSAGHAVTVP